MARTFKLNGSEILVSPNWNVADSINSRSTASFTAIQDAVSPGDTFQIYDDTELIFEGFVRKVAVVQIGYRLEYQCKAVDYSALADKRLVAAVDDDVTVEDVVDDILLPILGDEGVTKGDIANASLVRVVFNYITCADALSQICDAAGLDWNIDTDRKLNVFARSTYTASPAIDDDSVVQNFRIERSMDQYRNTQYIKGGKATTETQEDEKPAPKPDGISRTFTLRFPLSDKPRIYIDTVEVAAADIGINGVDENKKWWYQVGSATITQDDSETVLSDTQVLEVTYTGLYDLLVLVDDPSAIDDRKNAETSTSGVYEALTEDKAITDATQAVQTGRGLIAKYAEIADKITFRTPTPYKAGQLLPIAKTLQGVDDSFLIESVRIYAEGQTTYYDVSCLDGAALGGWEEFFKIKLYGSELAINEKILRLISILETINIDISHAIQTFATIFPASDTWMYSGSDLYMTATTEGSVLYVITNAAKNYIRDLLYGDTNTVDINYLAIGDGTTAPSPTDTALANEIDRVQVTDKDKTADGTLLTTSLLLSGVGTGVTFSEIGLFSDGTATADSGTLIARILYSKVKSADEELQILNTFLVR